MTSAVKIRIGTRKSALALKQAQEVRTRLISEWPALNKAGHVEMVGMTTSGDEITSQTLGDIGGKGLFTKEIEEALLAGRIDIAVHSVKDMQTVLPDGLIIGAMLKREDPRDMLVGQGITSLKDLPKGAHFGTSSLRRAAQVLMRRPDLVIVPLRGNVQTRLSKLEKGEVRATMLARAGVNRLQLKNVPGTLLPLAEFLPAVGQGAIGIECRADDEKIRKLLAPINHLPTEQAVKCERAFLRVLDGSCRTPIAGFAVVNKDMLQLHGLIAKPDGSVHHTIDINGKPEDAEKLGEKAGKELLKKAGPGFLG